MMKGKSRKDRPFRFCPAGYRLKYPGTSSGTAAQRGIGLVEVLVAVAILGTAVVAFVSALSAGSIAARNHETVATAQRLAQSQMEYVKALPYDPAATTYPQITVPAGYKISVAVAHLPEGDENIQAVTVTVLYDGEPITEIEGYKTNR
ncbi:MAG: hypothetical protein N2506_01790 [Dehalococcoidales bacterium]|nr:hypothetical protein [Dehalococcoidales bacterium]